MSSLPELTPSKNDLLFKSALAVLVFLVLIWPLLSLPWMHNDFLMLQFLTRSNPSISTPISVNWSVVWQQFAQPFMGDVLAYRPLSTAFFAALGQLTQFNPSAFHLLNLLIHLANTALMFRLLAQLGFGHLRLLACGLFLIHPVHVEALSWVLGGLDIWGSFWVLSALTCYCSFRSRSDHNQADDKRLWLIGFWSCFILGLLTKETALVLPFLLYWIESRQSQKSFQWVLLSFLAYIPYFFLTQSFLKNHDLSWFQLDYFAKPVLFLPVIQLLVGMNQEALIEQAGLTGWNIFLIVWLLGLAGLGGGFYVFLKTRTAAKAALFGVGAYILCLIVPSLPLLQGLDPMTMLNSRFLYLASIPFCGLLAGCLQFMPKHLYRYCLIGVFLVGTWVHAHAWQQSSRLETAFVETLLQRYGSNLDDRSNLQFLSNWPSVDQGTYILLQGLMPSLRFWPNQSEIRCNQAAHCEPLPTEAASIHWIPSHQVGAPPSLMRWELMTRSEIHQHTPKTVPVKFVSTRIDSESPEDNHNTVLPAIFANPDKSNNNELEQQPNTSDLLEVSLKGNERRSNTSIDIDRNAVLTVSWPVGFSMWMSKTLFHIPMDGKTHTLYLPLGNHKSWSALSVLPPIFVSVPSDVVVQSMTLRRKS